MSTAEGVVTPSVRAFASDLALQASSHVLRLGTGLNDFAVSRADFAGTAGTKAFALRISGQQNNLGGEGGDL